MAKSTFGKNILENLTTAMYSDSRIMFREYVQNSCDAIRSATEAELISHEAAMVDINIDERNRSIEISDNGTGIPRNDFERVLSDIANSDKKRGKDMGFRGIGRLCGLAYCSKLEFTSTAAGETDICVMSWDAEKMRAMLEDDKKYTAHEVLDEIMVVDFKPNSATKNEHYFKVLMSGIKPESNNLLNVSDIRNYLSFIAPVPYSTKFIYCNQIYEYAKKIEEKIDEYRLYVNKEQVFKNYFSRIYTKSGERKDEIRDVAFREFRDEKDKLLAWMWFGVSAFDGTIPDCDKNPHRSLRLRKANIQIGDEDTLRRLHKEPRGNGYFVGEVFAVHKELTPNARRDYFNKGPICEMFEREVKTYFIQTLYKLYYTASDTRSAYEDVAKFHKAAIEFKEKEANGFSGNIEKTQAEVDLEKKQEAAERAKFKIERFQQEAKVNNDSLTRRVREIVRTSVEKKEGNNFGVKAPIENSYENDNRKTKPR